MWTASPADGMGFDGCGMERMMSNRLSLRMVWVVSLVLACFVISGVAETAAWGKEAKDPAAKRAKKGAGKKAPGAPGAEKTKSAPAIRLTRLTDKKIAELHSQLDANADGSVSLKEMKALPTVLPKVLKATPKKGPKAKPAGEKKGGKKGGRRKKKGDPNL